MRFNAVLISVWNRCGGNQKSVDALKDFIIKRLSPELRPTEPKAYFYKKHSEHDGWAEIIKPAKVTEVTEETKETEE
jgi:hypothetical protein